MNKKADAAIAVIVIIAFILWLIFALSDGLGSRGPYSCRSNYECGADSYCGADKQCHQTQIIEKTVVQHSYATAALILAIAIVIAAVILKWDNFKINIGKKPKHDDSDLYYESQAPRIDYGPLKIDEIAKRLKERAKNE